MTAKLFAIAGLVAGLSVVFVAPANAHEKGAVRLTPREVSVGGQLTMNGERLSKNARFRLQLRGALDSFPLGVVRSDSAGKFEFKVTLPPGAKAGSYTVAVISSDDDVSAQADLAVAPLGTGDAGTSIKDRLGMGAMKRHEGMDMADMPHATAEPMKLPVGNSPGEATAIVAIIVLSLLGGGWLLTIARRSESGRA